MFQKVRELWNKHGFEIILIGSLFILFIYWLTRIGKKGTYSSKYMYLLPGLETRKKQRGVRQPIKESKGEKRCREVLEKIFNKKFPNCRPDFLNNPVTGGSHNLELDCFCDELKLCVEYSGKQHYEYIPYFHKNKEAFQNQKYRDFMKKTMCKDNDITLIEVPYTVKVEEIEEYLVKELKQRGYKV